jgi:catecholate siderophore receptor
MRKRAFAIAVAPLLFFAGGAFAEALSPMEFRGRVSDSIGSAVAGASVRVSDRNGDLAATAVTDAAGEFLVSVVPGRYAVALAAEGFDPRTREVLVGAAGARVEFTLDFIGFGERIEVEAADPYLAAQVRSATKTPTALLDVPQAVSVVTGALIADQRLQSMADVVRYMPGVGMAQGEGNRDTPVLRGNTSTSDFYVDGVRDDLQYFRDTYNLDRIEALKGPNGMIFGRGGTGGVINRVTRQAEWGESREVALQTGSWANRRATADFGQGLTESLAARITALYEDSNSYREDVSLKRYGVNPTLAWKLGASTVLRAGYEAFRDERTADRGISSFEGRPVETDAATFFGDPDRSHSKATVGVASATLEHDFGAHANLRSRISYGDYEKFYQNVFPGAVDPTGTQVAIQAYNNATQRTNLFQQNDLVLGGRAFGLDHTVLIGLEWGRQVTDNFRNTGFFTEHGPGATSILVPLENPTTSAPITFRQSATDADNHGVATAAAIYVQDQVTLSPRWLAVGGLRYDRFAVDLDNHRLDSTFSSQDDLVAPRLGLIYKPRPELSLYAGYGLSYLPRAGEQLASLSITNQALEPEEFTNYELGAKWDATPGLSLTAAVYRLDRGNVLVADPLEPSRSILVDAQRADGVEIGWTGRVTRAWTIAGGYAYQKGEILKSISPTARAGATPPHLPKHSASLWNRYELSARWGVGLGLVHRGEVYTSTDNTVTLPGYARVDAAVYCELGFGLRAQLNVENLADVDYFASANNNTNITPGSPRAARLALTARF